VAIQTTKSTFDDVLLIAVSSFMAYFIAFEAGFGIARERVVSVLTA
jgi:hypothetical protein